MDDGHGLPTKDYNNPYTIAHTRYVTVIVWISIKIFRIAFMIDQYLRVHFMPHLLLH